MDNAIHRFVFSSVRERFHARRAALFMDIMRPAGDVRILDLGGGWGDFLARLRPSVAGRFVVAEIGDHYADAVRSQGFEFVPLREGRPLPFDDGEFDIVVSNSVIEHVTLPKEQCTAKTPERVWQAEAQRNQQRFAEEIRRVGRAYFVQTPHRHFPIEAHTWLPLVNWFGHNSTMSVVRLADKYWVKQCEYADWRLLNQADLQALFPDARIHVERTWGLPKSLIAYAVATETASMSPAP